MCQLALSQTTPGHSLGVKPFQKSFPTSTQWPRLQPQCRSDHDMLFGLSIQESCWTCLIYWSRKHHWGFAVFNLRKKNLCSLLPFVLWHSQVTLQNSGWSYRMLVSKENLWHVRATYRAYWSPLPREWGGTRDMNQRALLVSSYNQNCSKDDARCDQCLQISQRASDYCCCSKDLCSFTIWPDRVGEWEDTSSGVTNIPVIERCNIKWLAANAGPAPKGESKEYEMQGVFL